MPIQPEQSYITALPNDCLSEIFTYLPARTIFLRVSTCCELWRSLLTNKDNFDFWVGLICRELDLPHTGEVSQWVADAIMDNGDFHGSRTYFLLVHNLHKIIKREPARNKTMPCSARKRKQQVTNGYGGTFGVDDVRIGTGGYMYEVPEPVTEVTISRNLIDDVVWGDDYHCRLLEEKPKGYGMPPIQHFCLGKGTEHIHQVSYLYTDERPEGAAKTFLEQEEELFEGKRSTCGFLFVSGNAYGEHWVVPSSRPWSALQKHPRNKHMIARVALAAVFNVMVSQQLLCGTQFSRMPMFLEKEMKKTGICSLESLLACVLDYIGLRCLLQFKAA